MCPAPCGAGGLKYHCITIYLASMESRPVWGGWIEMLTPLLEATPHLRPAPCGAGGLKCHVKDICVLDIVSRPVWGGWIEMSSGWKC